MTKLLLLDADVLIDLHSLDLFEKVCKNYEISITKSVFEEAKYYKKDGTKYTLQLPDEIEIIEDINIESLGEVQRHAKNAVLQIDPGEAASIAYLMEADKDIKFCTCDKAAITLISFMDLDNKCASLESALRNVGMHSTNAAFERYFKLELDDVKNIYQKTIKEDNKKDKIIKISDR